MQRPREQFLGIGFFHDLAEIKHRHAMAEKADGAEVVGNEKIGRPQFTLQPPQEVDDFGACCGIQRRCRLIQYDQLRPGDDGAPDPDALLLAGAQFRRKMVERVLRETEPHGYVAHARLAVGSRHSQIAQGLRPWSRRRGCAGRAIPPAPGTLIGCGRGYRLSGCRGRVPSFCRQIRSRRQSLQSGPRRRGRWSFCRSRIRRPAPRFRLADGEIDAVDRLHDFSRYRRSETASPDLALQEEHSCRSGFDWKMAANVASAGKLTLRWHLVEAALLPAYAARRECAAGGRRRFGRRREARSSARAVQDCARRRPAA